MQKYIVLAALVSGFIGFVAGWFTAMVTDAPSKRAVAKMHQLLDREWVKLNRARLSLHSTFILGVENALGNIRAEVQRLEEEL